MSIITSIQTWWILFKRPIVCFYERHTKGFSHCDQWDLDWFLADLIARALIEFRDSPHDCGPSIVDTTDEWDKILTTMIEGFEAAKEIAESSYTEELGNKFDLGMEAFHKYFFYLWT